MAHASSGFSRQSLHRHLRWQEGHRMGRRHVQGRWEGWCLDEGRQRHAVRRLQLRREMNLVSIPRMALKALSLNKLRTGLTMLGIIIGVGAVICVVAIGEGASARVEQAITNIGANMIWIEAGGVNRNGVRTGAYGTTRLSVGDFEAVKERVPIVTNVSPTVDTRVHLVYGSQNWNTMVRGVLPTYLAMRDWKATAGGVFT